MAYKLGSLFDGSGGFPLAGNMCGIEPVWASEVEPYPIAVTRSRFPNMKHLGDISKINGAEIEPVDIITFGSPCQDLSVAGKRAGLKHEDNGDEETTRSGLFMEAVRIIKEMREATDGKYPAFALWENVPGAFSSNKGGDFRTVLEELIKIVEPTAKVPEADKNGWPYADCFMGDGWSLAYRVFDAQYWGVPQRRRRIHLILDLRGERAGKILFKREGLRGNTAESGAQREGTAGDVENGTGTDDRKGIITAFSIENHPADSRVNIDDSGKVQTPTSRMRTSGGNVPLVMESVIDVEMEVAVRKHEVDTERLCALLRSHKGNRTNREIAEALNQPITLVEHWFRNDKSFAIPDADIWFNLKELLGIETVEFDQCVTEYEFKGGNYDMRNRIYTGDVAPTLTGGCGNHLHLVSDNTTDRHATVYSRQRSDEFCENIVVSTQSARQYKDATDVIVYRQGGFADYVEGEVGTLRAAGGDLGGGTENLFVTRCDGSSDVAYVDTTHADDVVRLDDKVAPLQARDYKGGKLVQTQYIVRRLTPTECARLQGFPDKWGHPEPKEDFTEEEYRFWIEVRNTHADINGKAVKEYTKEQMLAWYNKLHTDSSEYKMWGNGIALPPALYCMQGIAEALNESEN